MEIITIKVRRKADKKLLTFRFLTRAYALSPSIIISFLYSKFEFFDVDLDKIDRKMIDYEFDGVNFNDLLSDFHNKLYSEVKNAH